MALIDKSYFVGELNIPNTGTVAIGERLDFFIAKYEAEFLLKLMGYDLHKAFIAGIAEDPVAQQWTDLKTGVEYSYAGRNNKWRGLHVPALKQSPVANYVYYHWLKDQATQTVGLGEVETTAENSSLVSPSHKMIRAWNEMVSWIQSMVYFLDANREVYVEWRYQDRVQMRKDFWYINSFGL